MTPDQHFSRLVKSAMLGFALVFGYFLFADTAMPLTPQAMATRVVTKVTPQVSGKILAIGVANNQSVTKGELLFQIDPAPFELALEQAKLALEQARQDNAELDAALLAAEAEVKANTSIAAQKRSEAKRLNALFASHGVSQQLRDQADSDAASAHAQLLAAKARVDKLRVSRGSEGEGNLKLRQAGNMLAKAQLNLSYTKVRADQDGIVTNLQLEVGSFATQGQPLLALVSDKLDIIADFREKSLRNLAADSRALIAFDSEPGRLYPAGVISQDAGVSAGQFDANGRLASPVESDRWVRDAQRLRLHLQLEQGLDHRLPAGARATVQLLPDNSVTRALAWAQIKAISLLHYIY
ncbi:HlyD family secretion protein [Shewanella sp. AS16]|uniref:HlyD family secretion protein n=1 Tax=Shewanella sp. AS16 TaxID=2907625 RepID=UPI001F2A6C44|nr:HlyD family secretion protein [Shewanella sp. AS16]MCE9685748.1 HlyD family secretion protein [Shewanella sp. AS16]